MVTFILFQVAYAHECTCQVPSYKEEFSSGSSPPTLLKQGLSSLYRPAGLLASVQFCLCSHVTHCRSAGIQVF